MRAIDRMILSARRRSRRRARDRDLRALPGYVPARSGGRLSGVRRRSVAVVAASVCAVGILPAAGYGIASEVHDRDAQARYEAADQDYAEASAAYEAARAVEMEESGAVPENAVEYFRAYGDPESETARALQDNLDAAASEWSAAAGET